MNEIKDFVHEAVDLADKLISGETKFTKREVDELVFLIAFSLKNVQNPQRSALIKVCAMALELSVLKNQAAEMENMFEEFLGTMESKAAEKEGKMQ